MAPPYLPPELWHKICEELWLEGGSDPFDPCGTGTQKQFEAYQHLARLRGTNKAISRAAGMFMYTKLPPPKLQDHYNRKKLHWSAVCKQIASANVKQVREFNLSIDNGSKENKNSKKIVTAIQQIMEGLPHLTEFVLGPNNLGPLNLNIRLPTENLRRLYLCRVWDSSAFDLFKTIERNPNIADFGIDNMQLSTGVWHEVFTLLSSRPLTKLHLRALAYSKGHPSYREKWTTASRTTVYMGRKVRARVVIIQTKDWYDEHALRDLLEGFRVRCNVNVSETILFQGSYMKLCPLKEALADSSKVGRRVSSQSN